MISVIIPVHNVERFLEKCVKSVLENTYKDIEVILIENGSTDSSKEICFRLEKENPCVKVIVSEIKGVSRARNLGLDAAAGDYITFIDADDYVSPYYFETLLSCLEKHNADFVMCNFIMGKAENYDFPDLKTNCTRITADDFLTHLYCKNEFLYSSVAMKIINRKLADVRFDEDISYAEDRSFMARVIAKVGECVHVDRELYYYYRGNGNSICNNKDQDLRMDMVYSLIKDLDFFKSSYSVKQNWLDSIYVNLLLTTAQIMKIAKKTGRKDLIRTLKPINKEALSAVVHAKHLGKMKLRIIFEYYFPNTLQFLYRIVQKLKLR